MTIRVIIIGDLPSEPSLWDVCIVGAGPAGIALALECDKLGLSVLIVDAGGGELHRSLTAVEAEIINPIYHARLDLALASGLGGTSWLWGGRCVPFDELDFGFRAHVPSSGWPINHADIAPFYSRATELLGCGNANFKSPVQSWSTLDKVTLESVERWSTQPKLALTYRKAIAASKRLTLALASRAIGLDFDQNGQKVRSIIVTGVYGRRLVHSRFVVLAAGGLGTTRLLLLAQRQWPRHFGGARGALGHYYMGHLTGQISLIRLKNPRDIEYFDYQLDTKGHAYVQRRLAISEAEQSARHLLNAAFWLQNPSLRDPEHGNGVLSLIFLTLAVGPVGRLFASEPLRLANMGAGPVSLLPHVRNVLRRPHRTILDAATILRERYVGGRTKPSFIYRNSQGIYGLRYHAEQQPLRRNQVKLSEKLDAFGMPILNVDFRFTELDAGSVVRAHEILDATLRANGKGEILYQRAKHARVQHVLEQATDGYHQLGTTRMGFDKRASVVNQHCRVHDVDNLFVASSSVFATGGQANPTLLTVALAVRLAHHLSEKLRK